MSRLGRACALAVLLVVGWATAVRAEEGQVEPDRPDVTNSAKTVPPGVFQLESGVEYSRTSRGGGAVERRFGTEAVGRAGVVDRLELQFGWEPLVHVTGADGDTGVGDLTASLKYVVVTPRADSPWPSIGIQPLVKFPAAEEPIGSGRTDFALLGLASFDLPAGFGLDVNAGVAAIGQGRPSGYLIQALTSASLSVDVGAASPFVELFYGSRDERGGRDHVGLDAGVIYRVTRRVALDAAVETSLAGAGPDWAVRAGVSVRFGK